MYYLKRLKRSDNLLLKNLFMEILYRIIKFILYFILMF